MVNVQSQNPAKPSFLLHIRLVSWLAPPVCLWWRWMLTATASTMARPGRLVAASPRLRRQTWTPWTPWTPVTCTLLAVPWRGKRPADIERPMHQQWFQILMQSCTAWLSTRGKVNVSQKQLCLCFFPQAFYAYHPHVNMYSYMYHILLYHIIAYHIILYYVVLYCTVLVCFVLKCIRLDNILLNFSYDFIDTTCPKIISYYIFTSYRFVLSKKWCNLFC